MGGLEPAWFKIPYDPSGEGVFALVERDGWAVGPLVIHKEANEDGRYILSHRASGTRIALSRNPSRIREAAARCQALVPATGELGVRVDWEPGVIHAVLAALGHVGGAWCKFPSGGGYWDLDDEAGE